MPDAGASLSLGSDSHAVIDLFEEARAVELDERLASGERGRHGAAGLLAAATEGGHACLGWPDAGRIEPGARPDLVTVGLDGVRLAGTDPEHALDAVVFAGGPPTCATCSWTAARSWPTAGTRPSTCRTSCARPSSRWSRERLVIDNIGLLVTGEPSLGEGR